MAFDAAQTDQLSQVIAHATAPSFLLGAVSGFVAVLMGRMNGIIERIRTLNAIPDSINQDGGSQSSIKILAIGPGGNGLAGVPLRVDMAVGGVAQDFGTLSAVKR